MTVLVMSFTTPPLSLAVSPAAEVLHEGTGFSPGTELSRPLGIFFDTNRNECYVADTGNHQIVVYDDRGMPLYRFLHHVTRNGESRLGEPKSVAVDGQGRIFVTDGTAAYLDVLDVMGRPLAQITPPQDACQDPTRFDFVTLGPDDRVYATLSCRENLVIAVIGPELAIERTLRLDTAATATVEGIEHCMTGVAIDSSGRIYVTDPCAPLMVQIFDQDGRYLSGFGRHDSGFENFSFPAGIVVMANGDMWVVDTIRQVASCFSRAGEFVAYIGGKGDGPGGFNYPTGIAADGNNRVFVLERAGNRYQCFRVLESQAVSPEE